MILPCMNLLIRSILLLFSLSFCLSFGFIYKIERWEDGSRVIFTLSDWHTTVFCEKQIGNQQRREIVQAAIELDACVIVEDMHAFDLEEVIKDPLSYYPNQNNNNKIPYSSHQHDPYYSALIGLTAYCHQIHIPVDNVEFRLLKSLSFHGYRINPSLVYALEQEVIHEIRSYNDGFLLHNYYTKKLDEYNHYMQENAVFNTLLRNQKVDSLAEAFSVVMSELKCNGYEVNEQAYKAYVEFHDSWLLDLRIIHSVYQHRKYPATLICAGGAHINNIANALQEMGFIKTGFVGKDFTEKQYPVEPEMVSVAHYFKVPQESNYRKEIQRKLVTQHDDQQNLIKVSIAQKLIGSCYISAGLLLKNKIKLPMTEYDTVWCALGLVYQGTALLHYGIYNYCHASRYKETLLQRSEQILGNKKN